MGEKELNSKCVASNPHERTRDFDLLNTKDFVESVESHASLR